MKNKVLIKLIVPCLCDEYELFIPINVSIKKAIDLISNSLVELSDNVFDINQSYCLIDPETSIIYEFSNIIRNTNIRNNKKLILI